MARFGRRNTAGWPDVAPPAGTSYYYVRGEQKNGELVSVSPLWITRK